METVPRLSLEIVYPDRPLEQRTIHAVRTIIGRESGDIVLGDPETSALHAEIDCSTGHVIVRDLGSSNGTWKDDKRLPQFALFEGHSFRCGRTMIKLVRIDGGPSVTAGRTIQRNTVIPPAGTVVPSATQPAPSSTLLQGSGAARASSATMPGHAGLPQSASPTLPGALVLPSGSGSAKPSGSSSTLPGGPVPPPVSSKVMPPPSSGGPTSASPPAAAPRGPVIAWAAPPPGLADPAKLAAQGGVSGPSVDPRPPAPAAATPPAPTPPNAPLYRPPVPNAVIKDPSGKIGVPIPDARAPARRRGWLIAVIGVAIAAVVGGALFFGYTMLARRQLAFAREIARTLPAETLGFWALRSPRAAIELWGTEVPAPAREAAKENAGFDPFDLDELERKGLDVDAPLGYALLSLEPPIVALSLGTSDRSAFESTLRERASAWLGRDVTFTARTYGPHEGLALEGEPATAVVFTDDRAVVVWSFEDGALERVTERARALGEAETHLDEGPGFAGLRTPAGDVISLVYADGGSIRNALPSDGVTTMAVRMSMADLDAFALSLSSEDRSIRVTAQTVLHEQSNTLAAFEAAARDDGALDRLGNPILAAFDVGFDAPGLERGLSALGAFELAVAAFAEPLEGTGIDVRADILRNLSGSMGAALLELPSSLDAPQTMSAVAWVGLADEAKGKALAERVYGATRDRWGLTVRTVDGTTVYELAGPPRVSVWVFEGRAWLSVGDADVAKLLGEADPSFRGEPRHPAIAEVMRKGGKAAGFVDLRGLADAARPLAGERWAEAETRWADVLQPLQVLTLRTELHGRTAVTEFSLETDLDDPLPTLVQRIGKRVAEEVSRELESAVRQRRCAEVSAKVHALVAAEVAGGRLDPSLDASVTASCMDAGTPNERIDCYLAATSVAGLQACDRVGTVPADGGNGDKEPLPVPYIEDLWPNVTDPGTGRADPSVNYAVPVGPEPQVRGPADALVTIVEFGDFQCPYTKQSAATIDRVLAKHGAYTRVVFRHNPLPMHAEARLAARAAIAAGQQGKFWELHDKMFEHQRDLSEANIRTWAQELGLDMFRFDTALGDFALERRIDDELATAKKFGVTGTPVFFVNGRPLAGAQPEAVFDKLIEEERARAQTFVERRGNTRKRLYEDMIAPFAAEVGQPPAPEVPPESDERALFNLEGLPTKGAGLLGQVHVVACADFDCPFCARAKATVDQLVDAYPSAITLHFAHQPLPFHAGAEPAARAAIAADKQGKFWEMHDELFEERTKRSREDFVAMAKDLGLDVARFEADFDAKTTADEVVRQQEECKKHGASGTPTFFINGRKLVGAQPLEAFRALVDEELRGGI